MNSKTKNTLIGGLLAIVFVMAVGYAAFAQQLTINGSAAITSTWDVHIKSITAGTTAPNKVGTASVKTAPSFTATTATFSTNLVSPGDSLTYTIVVENSGTLNAKVSTTASDWVESSTDNGAIKYTLSGLTKSSTIAAGGSLTFTVKVEYKDVTSQPAAGALTSNYSLSLKFVQA